MPFVDLVARRASPAPVAPHQPHGETAVADDGSSVPDAVVGAGTGCRVLEESEDDDDVLVDDTDEDDLVDDLA